MTELNRLLQRLSEADVEFVIVGGFAAMLHGSSLLTRDVDVCAVLTAENLEKLRHVFRDLHPIHRMSPQRLSFLDNLDPGVPLKNLYLQTDFGPLDLLGAITGVGDFAEVNAHAIEIELFGRKTRVMSLDDLIKAKETLGREKDRLAARELRAIKEKAK